MSQPQVQIIIRGLKCDAAGCNFFDASAAPDERSLNRPCPLCGANLLTESDLAAVRLLQYAGHMLNVELGPSEIPGLPIEIPIRMDGTGTIEFLEPTKESSDD